ncbi:SIS domain-containing protein (plasmid) [Paracoccus kondratievae]|uniref:RpiR family transcriptional regulator n=1 Tax=Paracoccus kondratievae TaxID=135740 RepID=A0AAD3P056_9RHOB|nr:MULTISPECIES: MurR/RpiR family transcriptional regulator [Paracoccus]QFQ89846.1 SIS domain-containing protein [Paracoccus kondratievae]GLK64443.1 RpiR family transcriptional regulator [Paracoccus kondratievae]SMG19475.1 transcriptional regulator, RpiR family [Paracoccus sp. J56]
MTVSLLQRILHERDEMRPAERRVADYVGASPSEVIHMSMARLSELCSVSDPTIMRFCRRFGFEGYQDFKLNLAQSLVPSAPFAYEQITPQDSVANIVRKTCRNSLNAVQRLAEDLDPEQVGEGARLLQAASWTGIYATGISEVNALDAEHKFQRLGMRCQALLGKQRQWMHAERARPGEVALIFSQSGHTKQMVEVAIAARAGGARVVSVAAADSPLARVSDAVIAVLPYDRTELMTPLASRLNHHLVTNMLVTAIAIASGSEFPDQLPALDSWQTDKI